MWGALAIVPMGAAWAQVAPEAAAETLSQTFMLGTVEVSTRRDAEELGAGDMQRVGSAEMERTNANTVADAVRNLPGVSLSRNSRNEEMINLRGFDSRQVPILVDGVPLYVPYDGYVDLGRFTTFDLAEINVAKAGASLLYGPNTLGGAVNLVTRKPVKPFEGDVRLGLGSGSERKAAFNLGGNQGNWYYQLGASYLDADTFPLPKGFRDYKKQPTDTGSNRENADRTDKRLSFKLGLTPNATDEYAFGYVRQEGEGQSVYRPVHAEERRALLALALLGQGQPVFPEHHPSERQQCAQDASLPRHLQKRSRYVQGRQLHGPRSDQQLQGCEQGASVEWVNYAFSGHELHAAFHYKQDEHTDAASGRTRRSTTAM